MSDTGTIALQGALIAYLKAFTPAGGANSIGMILSGRLWAIRAPDNAAFPHGVLRLTGREQSGDDASLREEGRIEIMVFGRPLSQASNVEAVLDIAGAAFLKYSANHGGLFDVRARVTRDTLPPPPAPGDREIAQGRAVWSYSWWPDSLTQYAIAVGDAP